MATLEEQFTDAVNAAMPEITKHLEDARAALNKAIDVANKYGVPFASSISELSQSYFPSSFYSTFWERERSRFSQTTISNTNTTMTAFTKPSPTYINLPIDISRRKALKWLVTKTSSLLAILLSNCFPWSRKVQFSPSNDLWSRTRGS